MDLNRTPSRVLWLFAFYQAAVAAVYVAGPGGRSVAFGGLAMVQIAVAALLFRFASRPPSRETSRWRLALPYALWLACWLQLGWLIRFSGHPMHDAQIAAADLTLFGAHGHLKRVCDLPDGCDALLRAGSHVLTSCSVISVMSILTCPPV